jgi:hypothetical protein
VSSPVDITRDSVEAALRSAGGERAQRWNSRTEEGKAAYVQRLRHGSSEPAELSALLVGPEAAGRWADVHWLRKAEFCAWINEGRTSWTRRRRAAFALRQAPIEKL